MFVIELFRTERGVLYVGDSLEVSKSLDDSSVSGVVYIYNEKDARFKSDLLRILGEPGVFVAVVPRENIAEFFYSFSDVTKELDYLHRFVILKKNDSMSVFLFGKSFTFTSDFDILLGVESPLILDEVDHKKWVPTLPISYIVRRVIPEGTVFIPYAGFGEVPLVCETLCVSWVGCVDDPALASVVSNIITKGMHPNEAIAEYLKELRKEIAEKKGTQRSKQVKTLFDV